MNFNKIIESSYEWFSIKKVFWFVLFFWICLSFIVVLPQFFQEGSGYSGILKFIAIFLYDFLYALFVFGLIVLIQYCLDQKKQSPSQLRPKKVGKIILLVFVELFYIFVWNIKASFRIVQALLLIASALISFFFLAYPGSLSLIALSLVLLAYFFLVIRNAIHVFFSTTIFCNHDNISVKGAVKESWHLTCDKTGTVFAAILISGLLAFIMFAFITIVLGAVASIIFGFFFINSIAVSLGFKVALAFGLGPALIAYHYSIAEMYSQLRARKESLIGIKRALARRVLHPAKRPAKRKIVKKKSGRGR